MTNNPHASPVPVEMLEKVELAICRNIAGQMKAVVVPTGYVAYGEQDLNCRLVAKDALSAAGVSELIEALRFYADDNNYEGGEIFKNKHGLPRAMHPVLLDGGYKAQRALVAILAHPTPSDAEEA